MEDLGRGRTLTADGVASTAPGGASFTAGCHVGGRYEIVRFIAAGGMGEVYEAVDQVLGTRVALKAVRAAHAGSAPAVDRLKREIALARKVTHPNICRVHDVGEHAGRAFLTMELLGGETLADRLKRGVLDESEIERIAPQLVAALGALHAAGVVHRDFKSSNIVLDGERVVVTDFGLARSTEGSADARLTVDAALLGTPAYMAPEQVEGREATPVSDIYALGVVLYEMTTGALPFAEDTPLATATARLTKDPPVPDVAARWKASILRCLERAPEDRPRRVEDVLGARRRRRWWIAAAAVAAGTSIAIAGLAYRDEPSAVAATDISACAPAATRLKGVWDPDLRSRVEQRFLASPALHVRGAWNAIRGDLDQQAADWSRFWDAACASPDRSADPLLFAQRLTCADHRLIELGAHAAVLADHEIDVETYSMSFAGGLGLNTVDDCDEVALLRAQVPAPPPSARPELEAVMLRYQRARVTARLAVNTDVGLDVEDALAELSQSRGAARESGFVGVAGEIGNWHARYLTLLGRHLEADSLFADVIAVAEAARDDYTLVRALAWRTWRAGQDSSHYDATAAQAMLDRATTIIDRIGAPPSLQPELAEARLAHAMRTRRYDDAIRAHDEVERAMLAAGRPIDARVGDRALLRSWNGEPEQAVRDAEDHLAVREQRLGTDHVQVGHARGTLADVRARAGDLAGALADAERALLTYQTAYRDRTSPALTEAHRRASRYALALGKSTTAEGHLAALVQHESKAGTTAAAAYTALGFRALEAGQLGVSEDVLRRAIAASQDEDERAEAYRALFMLRFQTGEPYDDGPWAEWLAAAPPQERHFSLALIEARRGDEKAVQSYVPSRKKAAPEHHAYLSGLALLELGRPAEAVADLRGAVATFDAYAWDPAARGNALTFLGTALRGSGDDAGAIEVLDEALWTLGTCCGARSSKAQDARFALAQSLWDSGGDRERARALATEAHAALVAMGPSLARKAAAVAAWLEHH